jgi:hypothetical protein
MTIEKRRALKIVRRAIWVMRCRDGNTLVRFDSTRRREIYPEPLASLIMDAANKDTAFKNTLSLGSPPEQAESRQLNELAS